MRVLDKDILGDPTNNNNTFIIENIKAFHVLLRRDNSELLTYSNNLMLQKAVALINTREESLENND